MTDAYIILGIALQHLRGNLNALVVLPALEERHGLVEVVDGGKSLLHLNNKME